MFNHYLNSFTCKAYTRLSLASSFEIAFGHSVEKNKNHRKAIFELVSNDGTIDANSSFVYLISFPRRRRRVLQK